jgi:hypothetical protein
MAHTQAELDAIVDKAVVKVNAERDKKNGVTKAADAGTGDSLEATVDQAAAEVNAGR